MKQSDLVPIGAWVRRGMMIRMPEPCMTTMVQILLWYQGSNMPEHLRQAIRVQERLYNLRVE